MSSHDRRDPSEAPTPDDEGVLSSAPSLAEATRRAGVISEPKPASPLPPPTEFNGWRAKLARARGGQRLLDALIEPHDAARLIPALPVDDLHAYIHRIGLADADGVLALASGQQVRALLDTDVWTRDRVALDRLDPWLSALMQAGPEVLVQRLLDLDDSLLNWLVRRSVRVEVIEDPDSFDPPDDEHVVTPDRRLVVIFPESDARDLPVKIFLDRMMRDDPALCVNLLVQSQAALDSNLEEDAYRWRTGRMADRGYVDYYEALVIYTAPRPDQISDAREALPGGAPPVERWLVPVMAPEARLAAAFTALAPEALDVVQGALGYVANMALSADRIEAWDDVAAEQTLARLRAGLVLGLDALAGPEADAERDAEVLSATALALIFRTGYARTLDAVKPLRRAARDGLLSGPEGRLDGIDLAALEPWAEALGDRHPRTPDGPASRAADLTRMQRHAALIAALARAAGKGRPRAVGIGRWLLTWMARDLVGLEGPGPLPPERVEHAHRALFADGALRADARAAARDWWTRAGGEAGPAGRQALGCLLDALEQAAAAVAPTDLEPRFLPLWWIEADRSEAE